MLVSVSFAGSLFGSAPDTIFFGGDIITVDDAWPDAEAIAVLDGKIVFVGDRESF